MSRIKPMLASPAGAIPDQGDWIEEPKYDGWRTQADIDEHGVALTTRTGKPLLSAPYIAAALATLPNGTILDGEIVDLSGSRSTQWNRTQSILAKKKAHAPTPDDPPLTYVLFDVLHLNGENVMHEPLSTRRQMLKLVAKLAATNLNGTELIQIVPERDADGSEDFYNSLIEQGYEGIVLKKVDSVYAPGARNGSWLKMKPEHEMDVEITGTYEPEKGSKYDGNAVGGITFRARHDDGRVYNGRAAGMDDNLREMLHLAPEDFIGRVAEIAYASISDSGALRFPRFKRLREEADKSVAELTAQLDQGEAKSFLLSRALEAEERVVELEAENKELRLRLEAAMALDPPKRKRKTKADPGRAVPTRTFTVSAAPGVAPAPLGTTPAEARGRLPRVTRGRAGKTRNYAAMKPQKLLDCIMELRMCQGDAYQRAVSTQANGGWSPNEHLRAAESAASGMGLIP